ncbi:MAG: hypothetical protein J6V44_16520 [Methanobrevibacter sp.]|nr:hypothetical protein [Methanobrevibacter sp.]MBO7691993.1 hypothetical protein [Methanobrevibacter sp.]
MVLIKLEDGTMVHCYLSNSEVLGEGCDSVLGYDLYNTDGINIDGGEYDFNSADSSHLLKDLVEFITGSTSMKYEVLVATKDCCYDSIVELVEEEFDTSFKTTAFVNKLDSEILKSDIRALYKYMRR